MIAITTLPANAQPTVFGLKLGEPLTIAECPKTRFGYREPKAVCFEHISDLHAGPAIDETVIVAFPLNDWPTLSAGPRITGLIVSGRLEGIGFNTHGISDQDRVLSGLIEKFGEPSSTLRQRVQTAAGFKGEAITASWDREELDILFQGSIDRIDKGLVTIDTRLGAEKRAAALRALTTRRPL